MVVLLLALAGCTSGGSGDDVGVGTDETGDTGSTDGTDGTDDTGDTGDAPDEPEPQFPPEGPGLDCPGVVLDHSQTLDLDLRGVWLSGELTIDGQTVEGRGTIRATSLDEPSIVAEYVINNQPEATYELFLPPGRYRLDYQASVCQPSGVHPCNDGQLAAEIQLETDEILDFDISPVEAELLVTSAGGELPSYGGLGRGQIGLRSTTLDPSHAAELITDELPTSGTATAKLRLFPDTYDVFWANDDCTDGGPACGRGLLEAGLVVDSSGTYGFDLEPVVVSGNVTLAGGTLPDQEQHRGEIILRSTHGDVAIASLGTSGPVSYSTRIAPGSYAVVYASTCAKVEQMPCNSGVVVEQIELGSDSELDIDIPKVELDGRLTINAADPDISGLADHELHLRGHGQSLTVGFEAQGNELRYRVPLFPGSYAVEYRRTDQRGVVITEQIDLAAGEDVGLDIDVTLVKLEGMVSIGGEAQDVLFLKGNIAFIGEDGSFSYAQPSSGYEAYLAPGEYRAWWLPEYSNCEDGMAAHPCLPAPISEPFTVTESQSRNLSVPVITVSGTLSLNGLPLPEQQGDRGSLRFRNVGGGSLDEFLPWSGPASYAYSLVPGRYVISHFDLSPNCKLDDLGIPCAAQILACGE